MIYGDGVADIDVTVLATISTRRSPRCILPAATVPQRLKQPRAALLGEAGERRRLHQWRLLRSVSSGLRPNRGRSSAGRENDNIVRPSKITYSYLSH